MSAKKPTAKKKNNSKSNLPLKGILVVLVGFMLILAVVLKSSLLKDYPVEGKKQMLSIGSGETYNGFIDHLAKEGHVSFPILLKVYQRFIIHDTMKAGVYEVTAGMSVRQVLEMISNSENAQINRILVIEGTPFRQLIETLKKDDLVTKEVVHLPTDQLLKELKIPSN